jgi:hypothetical protein
MTGEAIALGRERAIASYCLLLFTLALDCDKPNGMLRYRASTFALPQDSIL